MTTTPTEPLTKERIHATLWRLAADGAGKKLEELTPQVRLAQDLGLDSLDVAELIMEVEEELGISLPTQSLENPELTLGQVEEAVQRLLP